MSYVTRENGLRALRQLSIALAESRASQFIHTFTHVEGDPKYSITHFPDRCPVCVMLNTIENALLASDDKASA